MLILNLGCGTKTSPAATNIDWTVFLRVKSSKLAPFLAPLLFTGERRARFEALDGSIIVHDLRRGIPADDDTADAVYHSHLLEHIDRPQVSAFFREVRRVLKPGGVQRIVVPDLERLAREYLSHLDEPSGRSHDEVVARMIEQMVRREPHGTSMQRPLRRRLENLALGDARRRGETHQWMWDRVNLADALRAEGFVDVQVVDFQTSQIEGWNAIGLDLQDSHEYKPGSLYIEAAKPR